MSGGIRLSAGKVLIGWIAVMLVGCAATQGPPRADLRLQRVVDEACTACDIASRPDGTTVHLQREPLIVADDIIVIENIDAEHGVAAVSLTFKPTSRSKMALIWENHANRELAWVAGDRILIAVTNREAFSEVMRITGLAGDGERDRLFKAMIAP